MPDDTTPTDIHHTETTHTATSATDTTTDPPPTAALKLWAAVNARPGATSDDLAAAAGIGRSTAAKFLARWVEEGTVERTPGLRQGRRLGASRFAVTTAEPNPAVITPAGGPDGATFPHRATDPASATDPHSAEGLHRAEGPHEDDEPHSNAVGDADSPDGVGDDAMTDDQSATRTAQVGATADAVSNKRTGTDSPAQAPTAQSAPAQSASARSPRLAAGALQGMVEDYLRDHPGDELGPTQIGHALRRSSGAISNALERLVASGDAVQTNDRPKRYRLATGSADPATQA